MSVESTGIIAGMVMMLCLPLHIYALLTKVEPAERYLTNCVFITNMKRLHAQGIFNGKLVRSFGITYVLILPRVFYWRRLVDLKDLADLPMKLKLWIVVPTLTTGGGAIIMSVCGLLLL